MAERTIVLRLNQQQTELLDRTVADGEAPDREALIRRALREYAERHLADAGEGR
jgi:Arc/MetJ-type ribon-helix-helix transcriptional regulator